MTAKCARRSHESHHSAILGLFFLSGAAGISYEVIWFKQFSHVWGTSTLAMASVVGAFLLGLGLGARWWGPIADRVAQPVLWYGVCEIGIGLLALIIPWETGGLLGFAGHYYANLRESAIWYSFIRGATTFVVIGPACMLMGGTLPLLVRHVASRDFATGGGVGSTVGWLYGVNTLGAALGCYLVGFHLLPEFGLVRTNIGAATVNIVVGLLAVSIAVYRGRIGGWAMPALDGEPAPIECEIPVSVEQSPTIRLPPILIVYFVASLAGCAALMLQTVWNRQLALVLGSSTYAFSAMLFVVLAGIGLGSLIFHALAVKHANDLSILFHVVAATIISTATGMWLLPFAADCAGVAVPLRANHFTNAFVCIAGSALIELLPAMAMGTLFPCLVHFTRRTVSSAGRTVGNVYACNTVGTLVGAIATSAWIVPTWGTRVAILVSLALYLCIAAVLAVLTRPNLRIYATLGLAGIVLGQIWNWPDDPQRLNMGMFLYGYNEYEQESSKVLFFKEGAACNVLVTQQGDGVSFRVNGKVDGSSRGDMAMQAGLAYIPRFLNPAARNVLVIGFGTGTTSGASLLFPETQVTCCEIEPAIIAAAPHFANVNHSPHESSRFRVIYDDARAFVQETDDRYDLILSEPSNPWIAGVSNLFTAEFYEIARHKLAPNGIFAQWIQTYSFAPDDYAMIVATMREAFPYLRLLRISDGDTILLASNNPLDRDATVVRDSQRLVDTTADIQADLNRYFETSNLTDILLARLLLDERGLKKFADANASGSRNRDYDLQLEFRAARHLYERHGRNVGNSILAAVSADWLIEHFERLQGGERHSKTLNTLATLLLNADSKEAATRLVQFGLSKAPNSPHLLASQLVLDESLDTQILNRLIELPDDSVASQVNRVGVAFWEKKRYHDAVTVFIRLCAKCPQSATSWTNLANNYERLGDRTQAEQAHRRALELDSLNDFSIRESKRLTQSTGRSEQ